MMQWITMLLLAFATIFVGAVVSEIPPFPGWFRMVDTNQTTRLLADDQAPRHRRLRCARFRPDDGRHPWIAHGSGRQPELRWCGRHRAECAYGGAASHLPGHVVSRGGGKAAGREGSEQFSFREMKQAWRNGAWRHETVWQRRFTRAIGALLLTIGIFGIVFTLGRPYSSLRHAYQGILAGMRFKSPQRTTASLLLF